MKSIVVVGGGIIGRAIALNLINKKNSVTLISPKEIEGIATTAAGGMLGAFGEITYDKTSPLDQYELEFRVRSREMYQKWLEEIEELSGINIFRKMGTFIIGNVAGKDDYRNLQFIKGELDRYNEKYETVFSTDIPNYKPNGKYVSTESIFLPSEGSVSSKQLLLALQECLKKSKLYSEIDDSVVSLDIKSSTKYIKTKSGQTLETDYLVLCAGVGIQKIIDVSNVSLNLPRLYPGKGTSLIIKADSVLEHVIRTPNRDFACGTHVVPREEGTIYVGATNRISSTPGSNEGSTAGEINSLLHSALHEINTRYRTANVIETNYGARPITEDRFPVVGETDIQGLYVATGTYRNGILMAPLIANLLVAELEGYQTDFENKFNPSERKLYIKHEELNSVISNGVRDLVSFIQEPTGSLPFNRQEELYNFINVLMQMLYNKNETYQELFTKTNELITQKKMSELIPQLFYEFQKKE